MAPSPNTVAWDLTNSKTSKQMYLFITGSDLLLCKIEAFRADLHQLWSLPNGDGPDIKRKILASHFKSIRRIGPTLDVSGPFRQCYTIEAPARGCRCQRLFGSLFAMISDDSSLYVWDLTKVTNPAPSAPPGHNQHIFSLLRYNKPQETRLNSITGDMRDVIIVREAALMMVLTLKYDSRGSVTQAIINLLDWSSSGNRPHPFCRLPLLTHDVKLGDTIIKFPGEFIHFKGVLLSLNYFCTDDHLRRRGVVWNIKTGEVVYDSDKTPNPDHFRHLVLISQDLFLVSTLSPQGNYLASGALELRVVYESSSVSEIIGVFGLPPLKAECTYALYRAEFHTSESSAIQSSTPLRTDQRRFPFVPLSSSSVQVLRMRYFKNNILTSRPACDMFYLVIHNAIFITTAESWHRNIGNSSRKPVCLEWSSWGPDSSYMTPYAKYSGLHMTSPICGSKVIYTRRGEGILGEMLTRVHVDDFNQSLDCKSRGCGGKVSHLEPHPCVLPTAQNPWEYNQLTWLPFHESFSGYFRFPQNTSHKGWFQSHGQPLAIMSEDMIVLWAHPGRVGHDFTAKWWIIPLLQDRSATPLPEGKYLPLGLLSKEFGPPFKGPTTQYHYDWACRICGSSPFSDVHLIFECDKDKNIVSLRKMWLDFISSHEDIISLVKRKEYDEAFQMALTRRSPNLRRSLSLAVAEMKGVYFNHPAVHDSLMIGPWTGREQENPDIMIFRTALNFRFTLL